MEQKTEPIEESLVWASKEGWPDKQFTMSGLRRMGQSQDGQSFNGWRIVEDVKTPDELNQVTTEKAAKAEAPRLANKAKKDSKNVQLNKPIEDAGKTENTAPIIDAGNADREGGPDSSQGDEGDKEA